MISENVIFVYLLLFVGNIINTKCRNVNINFSSLSHLIVLFGGHGVLKRLGLGFVMQSSITPPCPPHSTVKMEHCINCRIDFVLWLVKYLEIMTYCNFYITSGKQTSYMNATDIIFSCLYRVPVNSSHGQLVTAQNRMTSWPAAKTPCCDELTGSSNAVLSLL